MLLIFELSGSREGVGQFHAVVGDMCVTMHPQVSFVVFSGVGPMLHSMGRSHRYTTCVNDPYYAAHSTKDDERDLRVHGKAHVGQHYHRGQR